MTTATAVPQAKDQSPNPVLALWRFFNAIPGGRFFFDRMLDRSVPYGGSIDQKVQVLRPGVARVVMGDHKAVRNHLSTVHAAAVMNLAETAAGLALTSLLPNSSETAVASASIEYRKKARGPLSAECTLEGCGEGFDSRADTQTTEVLVRDRRNHIVAEARIVWSVSKPACASGVRAALS